MSIRGKIKSLTFHDGKADWEGPFGAELAGWDAKFRLELLGDETLYTGIVTGTSDSPEPTLVWENAPPSNAWLVGNLERFISVAFRECVHVGLVVKLVDMDEIESEYLLEEGEEECDVG
jgi:hypothetical protein